MAGVHASVEVDGVTHDVVLDRKASAITVDGEAFKVELERNGAGLVVHAAGRRLHVALRGETAEVEGESLAWRVAAIASGAGSEAGHAGGAARVKPPMNGKLDRLAVKPGQAVAKGDVLFVLEAMKMHNEVRSPIAGVVTAVHGQVGAAVEPSQVLVEISPS